MYINSTCCIRKFFKINYGCVYITPFFTMGMMFFCMLNFAPNTPFRVIVLLHLLESDASDYCTGYAISNFYFNNLAHRDYQ